MWLAGVFNAAVRRLGSLTLVQKVAKLLPTAWLDATETYAKSKIAVDLQNTTGTTYTDYLEAIEGQVEISELGIEVVFEQADETQISELGIEVVFEEV